MDIIKIGTELLASKLADNIDEKTISDALGKLLGSDSGNLNIGGLVSSMLEDGGLENIVSSWLGDGDNDPISTEQITNVIGQEKIDSFATDLNIDNDSATLDLAEIIPQLIDKSSSGGSLLDSIGGIEGLSDFAKKLF